VPDNRAVLPALFVVVLAATAPAAEMPAAVASPQLVRAAESAYAELERARELAGSDGALDELAASVRKMEAEVDRLRSAQVPGQTGPYDADYAARELTRRQAALAAWDERLSERVHALDGARTSVRQLRETWRLTAASLDPTVPPALAARAADVRERAAAVQRLLDQRLSAALELQDRMAAIKLSLSAALASLEAANLARREELFEIESTPLWRKSAWTRASWSLPLVRAMQTQAGVALQYAGSEPVRSLVHLVLFAALLAAGLGVTRKARAASPPTPGWTAAQQAVMRHPVDSAILMAICATPLVHPGRPPAIDFLMYFAGIVPIVRIASVLAPDSRRPVLAVAALFLTARLVMLAPHVGVSARLALLAVSAAAAAGCVAGLRSGGWVLRLHARRWKLPLVAATAAAAALFAVCAIANIAGNVSLAEFLTDATLSSVFGGAAVATCVAVLSGAFRTLLALPSSERFALVRAHRDLLARRADGALRIGALVSWGFLTLRGFHATPLFRETAFSVLASRVKVGGLDLSVGDVVAFAATLAIAVWLSRALKFFLDESILPAFAVQRGSAAAISTSARYVVVGVGFGAALLAAGVEMTRFTVLAGTLGVGIGFGLQNVVNNFVSGLILLYEQPVQVGDVIEVGQLSGEVRRIGVRSSTVRTFQGADVIVPNSNFISAEVVNWTRSDRFRRVDIELGVAYGSEPARVAELLVQVAAGCAAVAPVPAPVALFTGFGESALQFQLRIWTTVDDWTATASALRSSISDVLPRAGVVLAFPQLDLWVRSMPAEPGKKKVVPGGVAHVGRAAKGDVPPRG
jgi:potassium-dependent mechanosensitive channel